MSILNVHVARDSVLVATDTSAKFGGSVVQMSKAFTFPHAKMVMACRGDLLVLNAVASAVHCLGVDVDVCNVASMLPEMAQRAVSMMEAAAAEAGRPYQFDECELVVAGWSPLHERMLGWTAERLRGAPQFVQAKIDPWRIGPDPGLSIVPRIDTVETMEWVAKHQVRELRKLVPNAAVGGRLHVLKITRHAMAWHDVADLEAPSNRDG